MKIVKNHDKIVCELKGCSNDAVYKLVLDDHGEECIRLCEKCLNDFYVEAGKNVKAEEEKNAKNRKNR